MRSVKVTENVNTKYIQNDVTMNMISGLQYPNIWIFELLFCNWKHIFL